MARITHVKAARQRFATVPVIDPATGEQECSECGGSGEVDEPETEDADGDTVECSECAGSGEVEATEVTENQTYDWEAEVDQGADILGDNPL